MPTSSRTADSAPIAFGAGFMLAVALLGVMPEVLRDSADAADAAVFVLLGYLAVHLAQHVLTPHFHFGEETHSLSASAGMSALLGLTLHTFFDGVAIASGFLVSERLGILLFLAVLLHKLPEGVTIASVIVAGGQSRSSAVFQTDINPTVPIGRGIFLDHATGAQVVDATFDDGFVSEGEQRLERAHAAGAAGGEKNCCDLSH